MSNKASDSLYRLIKSMTKPEKRYFKVFSSRHVIGEVNNYQLLFDAIDKQSVYDEEKLMKKFAKEAFVKRFSIAKSRLHASILKSLDAFHSNSSVEAQLKRTLHCVEILYNKSLYDQSLKLLTSAKKTAQKHEKISTLLEISKWEKRLIEKDNYEGISQKQLDQILADDAALISQTKLFSDLWAVKSRIFRSMYVKGKTRSTDELDQYKNLIENLLPNESQEQWSTENSYLYNHLYSAYYYGMGDYESCYPFLVKNVELIEKNAHIFQDESNIYLSVLTNAIYVAGRLGKVDEAALFLCKLTEPPNGLELRDTVDLDLRYFILSKSTALTLSLQQGEYDDGIALIPEIEEGMLKYDAQLSSVRKAFFYFNISILFFKKEHFNESLKWINQLLNNISIDETQDIHCMGQLLNMVIHLELGNKSLLPYTLRSTQRYLETRNKVYAFETVFLDFVNALLKKRQSKRVDTLYSELADKLEALKEDHFEKHAFEFFDFAGWAREKALLQSNVPAKEKVR